MLVSHITCRENKKNDSFPSNSCVGNKYVYFHRERSIHSFHICHVNFCMEMYIHVHKYSGRTNSFHKTIAIKAISTSFQRQIHADLVILILIATFTMN